MLTRRHLFERVPFITKWRPPFSSELVYLEMEKIVVCRGSNIWAATAWRIAIPVLLGAGYVGLTFNSRYRPFLFDEALFLVALRDGTPAFFPGYLGFLSVARAFSTIFSPAASLNLVSSLFGSASVIVFWLWLRRLNVPSVLALAGTLVFATGVYQLYNSSVGVTYEVEAFAYLLVGYLCQSGTRKDLYWAAATLALSGAIRQTTPFFLLPLFLFYCYRVRDAKPVFLFGALTLVWLIPTVKAFGGAHIVAEGSTQVIYAVIPGTLFHGPKFAAANLLRFLVFITYGAHMLLLFAWRTLREERKLRNLAIVWIGPGTVFFALGYIAWPGYTLGILSVLILFGVRNICQLRPQVALGILVFISTVNCIQFYALRPMREPLSFPAAIATAYAFQYSRAAVESGFQRRLQDFAVIRTAVSQ
jgi:hypothetical protein